MATETTFIMVKPDGVHRCLMSEIMKRFEQRGYKLVACKFIQATEDHFKKHYAELSSQPFFPKLIKFSTSGPVLAMVWEGKDIVNQGRKMLGETDPLKSSPGSIRGDLSIDIGRNIIHGSDSLKTAEKEIALWFTKEELIQWKSTAEAHVYES